ncbi:MAG: hypothetical protein ACJ8H8_01245 [Geminicoccaceae bacterium]
MRISRVCLSLWAVLLPSLAVAQATAPQTPPASTAKPSEAEDKDRTVAGGGVTAPGWTGKIDAKAAGQGMTIKDSKFEAQGDGFHLTTGPATTYWNPKNVVTGDYTVKATFTEPKQDFSHPHPMGLFIGGAKLGTPEQSLMYCVAYRNGTFLVRRFNGDAVTNVVPRTPNDAVKKAAGPTDPVTQEVAWVVKGGKADCVINGTSVVSLPAADIVGPGKLESTDGIWGIRVSHNMDLSVAKLSASKN